MNRYKKLLCLFIILIFSINISNAEIKDSLFATVGDKAITESDIIEEIKTILILSDQPYTLDKKEQLQSIAVRENVKRNIKRMEIEKYNNLTFNEADLSLELIKMADAANSDIETLKIKFLQNGMKFSKVIDNIKTELLWNSLIFSLYKNRLSINMDEVNEQLEEMEKQTVVNEYLISEIITKPVSKDELDDEIKKIKEEIIINGFEKVAMERSISDSSINGGNLGWVEQGLISKEFSSKIINTPIGEISEPILLPEGILFFKVRDKKVSNKIVNKEVAKKRIIASEKAKILNMYSLSHYDNLRRTVAINYY